MKTLGINDILETKRFIMKIPEEVDAEYIWGLINEDTTQYMIKKHENVLVDVELITLKKIFLDLNFDTGFIHNIIENELCQNV
jgi:hypothetical protein